MSVWTATLVEWRRYRILWTVNMPRLFPSLSIRMHYGVFARRGITAARCRMFFPTLVAILRLRHSKSWLRMPRPLSFTRGNYLSVLHTM